MVETKGDGGLPRCKAVKTANGSALKRGDTLSVPLSRLIHLTSSELAELAASDSNPSSVTSPAAVVKSSARVRKRPTSFASESFPGSYDRSEQHISKRHKTGGFGRTAF